MSGTCVPTPHYDWYAMFQNVHLSMLHNRRFRVKSHKCDLERHLLDIVFAGFDTVGHNSTVLDYEVR